MKTTAQAMLFCILGFCSVPGTAAVFPSDSTSGGIILREDFGARALGMGSAFTAVADDAACLDWNPAGLIRNPGSNLEAGHLNGIDGSAYDQLSYTQNLGPLGVGAGLSSLHGGLMNLDHADGTASTVQSENDLVGIVGLGVNIRDNLAFGMNVKFLQSTLAETDTARSIMTGMGILLDLSGGYLAGFSLQNFGSGLKYQQAADPLPIVMTLAFSYQLELLPGVTGLFAGDIVKATDSQTEYHLGAEYGFGRIFFLRLGCDLGQDLGGSTAGFGCKWENFSVNYGWADMGSFQAKQKISLDIHW